MTELIFSLSVITLNINGLNCPIKRPNFMLSTRDSLEIQRCKLIESERMERDTPCKWYQYRPCVTILISNKMYLKSIPKQRRHKLLIEVSIQEEHTITNTCTPNDRLSKYVKQNPTELKGDIDSSTVVVGDFNPSPSEDT